LSRSSNLDVAQLHCILIRQSHSSTCTRSHRRLLSSKLNQRAPSALRNRGRQPRDGRRQHRSTTWPPLQQARSTRRTPGTRESRYLREERAPPAQHGIRAGRTKSIRKRMPTCRRLGLQLDQLAELAAGEAKAGVLVGHQSWAPVRNEISGFDGVLHPRARNWPRAERSNSDSPAPVPAARPAGRAGSPCGRGTHSRWASVPCHVCSSSRRTRKGTSDLSKFADGHIRHREGNHTVLPERLSLREPSALALTVQECVAAPCFCKDEQSISSM
jgi:hypothetical protein